jgi:hypothetical protein
MEVSRIPCKGLMDSVATGFYSDLVKILKVTEKPFANRSIG